MHRSQRTGERRASTAPWSLAIDLGTSSATAAIAEADRVEVLEIEGAFTLPSVVCLADDGGLLVGRSAVRQAVLSPDRAERAPKRAVVAGDHVRLGGRVFRTATVVAALYAKVAAEAFVRFDGQAPERVVLTHPAGWGERELAVLFQAATEAGLQPAVFVPEPVAAAHHLTTTHIPDGGHVAVYDLGAGTFDATVLRHTEGGFALAGPPGGNAGFGGDELDAALRAIVAAHARAEDPRAWEAIWTGHDDPRSAAVRAAWQAGITAAREALSSQRRVSVVGEGFESGIRVTRAEFEHEIEQHLRTSIRELEATVRRAGLRPAELAAVYLTGGASRTARIFELVIEMFGILPGTCDAPATAVVLGSLGAPIPATTRAGAPPLPFEAGAPSADETPTEVLDQVLVADMPSADVGPSAEAPSVADTQSYRAPVPIVPPPDLLPMTGAERPPRPRRRAAWAIAAVVVTAALAGGAFAALPSGSHAAAGLGPSDPGSSAATMASPSGEAPSSGSPTTRTTTARPTASTTARTPTPSATSATPKPAAAPLVVANLPAPPPPNAPPGSSTPPPPPPGPTSPAQTPLPNCTSAPLATCRQLLSAYAVTVVRQTSASVPSGQVISTSPGANTPVSAGAPVTVYVSTGPAMATVPPVTQDTYAQAQTALTGAGLGISGGQATCLFRDYVISQRPSAGTPVPAGSVVDVTDSCLP